MARVLAAYGVRAPSIDTGNASGVPALRVANHSRRCLTIQKAQQFERQERSQRTLARMNRRRKRRSLLVSVLAEEPPAPLAGESRKQKAVEACSTRWLL